MTDEPKSSPADFTKNPQGKHLRSEQRLMAYNVYKRHLTAGDNSKSKCVKLTAIEIGIGVATTWKIVKEMENEGTAKSPSKKRNRSTLYDELSEAQRKTIRRIIHNFFKNNETPTMDKVNQVITDDETLPPLSRSSVWRILKKLGFIWQKRVSNGMRPDNPIISEEICYIEYTKHSS